MRYRLQIALAFSLMSLGSQAFAQDSTGEAKSIEIKTTNQFDLFDKERAMSVSAGPEFESIIESEEFDVNTSSDFEYKYELSSDVAFSAGPTPEDKHETVEIYSATDPININVEPMKANVEVGISAKF